MIGLAPVYVAIGLFLMFCAIGVARDRANPRRQLAATFWAMLGLLFVAGDRLPKALVGACVLGIAAIAGCGGVRGGRASTTDAERRERGAVRLGHRLLVPALLIPALTIGALFATQAAARRGHVVVDPKHATLVCLALACGVAFVAASALTRESPRVGLDEGRHILSSIGWAAVLPLLLAMLGSVFAKSGVGAAFADLVVRHLALENPTGAVVLYGVSMAALTAVLGNAFAAFPVIAAGIGAPLLVTKLGADPAVVGSLGMLTGYCGTLLSPMAANYNVVPAALLELKDPHGVIKAQAPTGIVLLVVNLALMRWLAFR